MYVFAPGAGCTGTSRRVEPGDNLIFTENSQMSQDIEVKTEGTFDLLSNEHKVKGSEVTVF